MYLVDPDNTLLDPILRLNKSLLALVDIRHLINKSTSLIDKVVSLQFRILYIVPV